MRYYALYKNGEAIERDSFEMLTPSDSILLYAKANVIHSYNYGNHIEYCVLDSTGKNNTLLLNDCILAGFRTTGIKDNFYLEIDIESLDGKLNKVRIQQSLWINYNELATIAHFVERIKYFGYEAFCLILKLENENRELKKMLKK